MRVPGYNWDDICQHQVITWDAICEYLVITWDDICQYQVITCVLGLHCF